MSQDYGILWVFEAYINKPYAITQWMIGERKKGYINMMSCFSPFWTMSLVKTFISKKLGLILH